MQICPSGKAKKCTTAMKEREMTGKLSTVNKIWVDYGRARENNFIPGLLGGGHSLSFLRWPPRSRRGYYNTVVGGRRTKKEKLSAYMFHRLNRDARISVGFSLVPLLFQLFGYSYPFTAVRRICLRLKCICIKPALFNIQTTCNCHYPLVLINII